MRARAQEYLVFLNEIAKETGHEVTYQGSTSVSPTAFQAHLPAGSSVCLSVAMVTDQDLNYPFWALLWRKGLKNPGGQKKVTA